MRMPISKKLRFEVLKRDKFQCQYCGVKAGEGDIVLHIDHIIPVASGGETEITNLTTACQPCNLGKGKRELSDDQTLTRQIKQTQELAEKRDQMQMFAAWRKELKEVDTEAIQQLCDHCDSFLPGEKLGVGSIKTISKLYKSFGFNALWDAVSDCADKFLEIGSDGRVTNYSFMRFMDKVGAFAYINFKSQSDPLFRNKYWIRQSFVNGRNFKDASFWTHINKLTTLEELKGLEEEIKAGQLESLEEYCNTAREVAEEYLEYLRALGDNNEQN